MSTRILYIEDNLLNMRLVRKILGSFGYTMLEAVDGTSGLRRVHSEMGAKRAKLVETMKSKGNAHVDTGSH
jgi:CheY-like chemotaxis protein